MALFSVSEGESLSSFGTNRERLEVAENMDDKPGASKPQEGTILEHLLEARAVVGGDTPIFAVQPLSECPHLDFVEKLPEGGFDIKVPCRDCGDTKENWICLTCYQVFCGRFVNQHMVVHHSEQGHSMTLGFSDLSVWCYDCESYVHNPVLFPAISHAHELKFGTPLSLSQ